MWTQPSPRPLPEAIIVCNMAGKIKYLNATAARLLTADRFPAINRALTDYLTLHDEASGRLIGDPVLECLKRAGLTGKYKVNVQAVIHKNDERIPIELSAALLRDGRHNLIGVVFRFYGFKDHPVDRLSAEKGHDKLTRLLNRREFKRRLNGVIDHHEQRQGYAVLYLDLDRFKSFNAVYGRAVGDEVLRQTARFLKSKAHKGDTLARWGSDEFCLLMECCPLGQALRVAHELSDGVNTGAFLQSEWAGELSVSIGLVALSEHHQEVGTVLSEARLACSQAKQNGRGKVAVFQAQ